MENETKIPTNPANINIEAMTPDDRIAFLNDCRIRIRRAHEQREAGLGVTPANDVSADELRAALQALRLVRSSAAERTTAKRQVVEKVELGDLQSVLDMGG